MGSAAAQGGSVRQAELQRNFDNCRTGLSFGCDPGLLTDAQRDAVRQAGLRRNLFTSVKELEARLAEYIDTYNENQPFVWTKSAKQILEKVGRARQTLGHHSA